MKFEDLPIELQKQLSQLRYAYSSIENEIDDALKTSNTVEEFVVNAQSSLEDINQEVQHYWGIFNSFTCKTNETIRTGE